MTAIIFKIIKIAFFFASSFFSARFLIKKLNRGGKVYTITDPEIAAGAILCGAVLTMIFSFLLKAIF